MKFFGIEFEIVTEFPSGSMIVGILKYLVSPTFKDVDARGVYEKIGAEFVTVISIKYSIEPLFVFSDNPIDTVPIVEKSVKRGLIESLPGKGVLLNVMNAEVVV